METAGWSKPDIDPSMRQKEESVTDASCSFAKDEKDRPVPYALISLVAAQSFYDLEVFI